MSAQGATRQRGRLVRASAIVVGCILVPAVSGMMAQSEVPRLMGAVNDARVSLVQTTEIAAVSAGAELEARNLVASQVTSSLSKEARSALDQEVPIRDLPTAVATEIALPPSIETCLFDQASQIIAYFGTADIEGELTALRSSMEAAGWRAVSLGGITGDSFHKSEGTYRFAVSTVTQIDGGVLVVVRFAD